MRSKVGWRIAQVIAAALSFLAFTPVVIPAGVSKPWLMGMPLTLWAGLAISFGILGAVLLGAWASSEDGN